MPIHSNSRTKSIITLLGVTGVCLLILAAAFFQSTPNAQAAADVDHTSVTDNLNSMISSLDVVTSVTAAAAANTALITPTSWVPPDPAYKVYVEEDGFFRLTYTDLQNAGVPVDAPEFDPATIQMYFMGREIAIVVEGESDGQFNPGDGVIFYGRSVDSLYYEGLLPDHKYTGTNVYWLSYGGDNGLRIAPKNNVGAGVDSPGFISTERWEEQKRYVSEYPRYTSGPMFHFEDDHWFNYLLQGSGSRKLSQVLRFPVYFLTPDFLPSDTYSATMRAHVVGGNGGTHGVRLFLNDNPIYENETDWKTFEAFTTGDGELPQTLLRADYNWYDVEFYAPAGQPVSILSYIDWVEISYYRDHIAVNNVLTFDGESGAGPWRYTVDGFTAADIRVYDVTDLFANQQIVGAAISGAGPYTVEFSDNESERRYVAVAADAYLSPTGMELVVHQTSDYTPSRVMVANHAAGTYDLLDTRNGADWIAIAPREYWDEIMPLVEHRAKRYRVALVDVQDIYDQFNGGLMSAESIHDFLEYTYHNWTGVTPEFVLLVGGGTSDMRNYLGNSKATYIPPYLVPVDSTLGETASDNRFVTFVGDDILPDMSIGRFPGYSEVDIATMVDKSIHYEQTPTLNDWNTNVLMISDDLEGGGGNFYDFSDEIIYGSDDPAQPESTRYLPEPYTATKVYLAQNCDDFSAPVANECRTMISDTINVDGAFLVSYVGHAQIKNWATERLLDQVLATSLTNYDKLSLFLSMACFEGFFFEPARGSFSLAETYLHNPNGGAVASWSPTGFGLASGHDWMEKGIFLELFQKEETVFGRAMTHAKYYLAENAGAQYVDLIDTFLLFGDPALQVQSFATPTAVDIADFAATRDGADVTVSWSTANEVEILGFNLFRGESADGEFVSVNDEPIWANSPGSATGGTYEFHDLTAVADQAYWYRLQVLFRDGGQVVVGLVELTTLADENTQLFLPIVTK